MIVFLANSKSPHITPWASHFPFDYNIIIYSITPCLDKKISSHLCITPSILLVNKPICFLPLAPKALRYVLLGLYLRFNLPKNTALHAHGASGNGLAALISGHKYLCTIYGSELFCLSQRSFLYNLIIKTVFRHANSLSASTIAALPYLEALSSSLLSKTHVFSLGISRIYFEKPPEKKIINNSRTWFINRRVHPHYRTNLVVKSFLRYRAESGCGRLIILAGDYDPSYLVQVKKTAGNVNYIDIIEDRVDECGMRDILDKANFAISTPKTDQLSSAILEAMSRDCINILVPLKAYQNIPAVFLDKSAVDFEVAIFQAFVQTGSMKVGQIIEIAKNANHHLHKIIAPSTVANNYRNFIGEVEPNQSNYCDS